MTVDANAARRVLRRALSTALALGVVAALLLFVGARQSPMVPVSGTDFTISGSVSNLYPGVAGSLILNVQNAKAVPITVTSLRVAVGTVPAGCPASHLDLSGTSFNGSFDVPAGGNADSPTLPIALFSTAPDACKNVSFGLDYSGTATYIEVFATSTGLVSSVNPSTVGQSVTFTATVTPTGTPPGPVTGSVTFSDGATPLGTVPVGAGGQAQLMTPSLTAGPHPITAVYSNSDGNFSSGTSPNVTQQVNAVPGSGCVATTSRPGVVTASTGWALRNTLTTGSPTTTFTYGVKPLIPIMGDWDGDGTATAGTYEAGTFRLRNTNSGGAPDITFTFGDPRGYPVVGDFDGNCIDDVAVYRAGLWQVHHLGAGAPPDTVFNLGSGVWPNVVPVAGDWDGDGIDGVGTYTSATGGWSLRSTATTGPADAGFFIYMAGAGSYPVVGDWNGDGIDTVGIKNSTATWSLRNTNASGPPEITFTFGASNDLPVVWAAP